MSKVSVFEYLDFNVNDREWRWRVIHDNGNILADSGEGYKNRKDMRKVWFNIGVALIKAYFKSVIRDRD